MQVFPVSPSQGRTELGSFFLRELNIPACCSRSCSQVAKEAVTREPGHLQTLSLLHGFLLGPKGTDVTKPMASSLIRIERWPPAQLMEGCGNQADSSITPRAEPGQPGPNELGCDGAAEGQPGGARQNCNGILTPSSPQRCGEGTVFNFV